MWGGVWGELAPKEKQNRVLCFSKGVTKNRSRPLSEKKSRVHFHRRAFLTWIIEVIPGLPATTCPGIYRRRLLISTFEPGTLSSQSTPPFTGELTGERLASFRRNPHQSLILISTRFKHRHPGFRPHALT